MIPLYKLWLMKGRVLETHSFSIIEFLQIYLTEHYHLSIFHVFCEQ